MSRYNPSQIKLSVFDPYKGVICEWLNKDETAPKKQHLTARATYEKFFNEYEFTGSEFTVRRFVSDENKRQVEMFIPLTADWGKQA